MGHKNCTQSVNTSREVISEIYVSDISDTTKQLATKESSETLTPEIDIQKCVLTMQETNKYMQWQIKCAYKRKMPEGSDIINRPQNESDN